MEDLQDNSEVELKMSVIPSATWSQDEYYLDEIVDKFELPQIVKICSDIRDTDIDNKIDVKQPFLVYSRRRRTKVFAEFLWWDEVKNAWVVDGPLLEIPKDYTGWFEIVKTTGDKLSEFPSPCNTLSQIIDDGCEKFLVRSTLMGHHYTEEENGISLKNEITIYPGEILFCKGIGKRKWKIKEKISNITKEPETKFVKCKDHRNQDVCFPLCHPGMFSPVYEQDREPENPQNAVYQIADILDERMTYPVHVKLAFGWMPPLPRIPRKWQGVLSLVASSRPDTIVVCSLVPDKKKMPLIEIPVDMDVQVKAAENREDWSSDNEFKQLMKKCYSKVYPFLTSVKYLDMKYQMRNLNSKSTTSNGTQKRLCRMTSPVDMSTFNPLDVFPPLAKPEDISESWALSFKDPELNDSYILDISGISLDTTSSTSTDASDVSLLHTHNRSRRSRESMSGNVTQQKAAQRVAQGSNLRAIKEKEISQREASC